MFVMAMTSPVFAPLLTAKKFVALVTSFTKSSTPLDGFAMLNNAHRFFCCIHGSVSSIYNFVYNFRLANLHGCFVAAETRNELSPFVVGVDNTFSFAAVACTSPHAQKSLSQISVASFSSLQHRHGSGEIEPTQWLRRKTASTTLYHHSPDR